MQNLFPSWTVVFSRLFALWERFDKKYIVDSFEGKKAKKEVYFPRNHPLSGNQRIFWVWKKISRIFIQNKKRRSVRFSLFLKECYFFLTFPKLVRGGPVTPQPRATPISTTLSTLCLEKSCCVWPKLPGKLTTASYALGRRVTSWLLQWESHIPALTTLLYPSNIKKFLEISVFFLVFAVFFKFFFSPFSETRCKICFPTLPCCKGRGQPAFPKFWANLGHNIFPVRLTRYNPQLKKLYETNP